MQSHLVPRIKAIYSRPLPIPSPELNLNMGPRLSDSPMPEPLPTRSQRRLSYKPILWTPLKSPPIETVSSSKMYKKSSSLCHVSLISPQSPAMLLSMDLIALLENVLSTRTICLSVCLSLNTIPVHGSTLHILVGLNGIT